MRIWITRLFQVCGCARSEPQVLTALQSLKLFREQVYDGVPALQGKMSWKHHPVSQPRETFSVTRATESLRLTHLLTQVFLSQLTAYHLTFPKVHTQPNSTYPKTVWQ